MATPDLTDYQERALIALVDLARSEYDWRPGDEHRFYACALVDVQGSSRPLRVPTCTALARLGLIEFRPQLFRPPAVRATAAGIALCNSMGD